MIRKKYYLTEQGINKVKKELEVLEKEQSLLLDGSGPRAFRFGEIEAEYFIFQENLMRTKERIAEFKNILKDYKLIKIPPKEEQNKVGLGAKVTVEVDGDIDEFFILGTLEANPAQGKISDESPVGRALLGCKIGDEAVINSPIKITYKIKNIKYGK